MTVVRRAAIAGVVVLLFLSPRGRWQRRRQERLNGSVSKETDDPAEAYADWRAEGPDVRVPNPLFR